VAIKNDIEQLIPLSPVAHILNWANINTDADKKAIYSVLNNLRNYLSTLTFSTPDKDYNFFAKDFYAIYTEMIAEINKKLPDVKDFSEPTIEGLILEAVAHQLDKLFYLSDQLHRQNYRSICDLDHFMYIHAKNEGYTVQTGVASSLFLTLTLGSPILEDIVYTSANPLTIYDANKEFIFQNDSSLTINAGATTVSFYARNWQRQGVSYTGNSAVTEYKLPGTPFLSEGLTITIDTVSWSLVNNFLDSSPTDKHYIFAIDEKGEATIRLNYNQNGAAIDIAYNLGGLSDSAQSLMSDANFLLPGSIDSVDSLKDILGNPVENYAIYNETSPINGQDVESLEEIRNGINKQNRKLDRTITPSDFELNSIDGSTNIARALAVDSQRSIEWGFSLPSTYTIAEKMIIYLVPNDPSSLVDQSDIDAITQYISNKKPAWNSVISENSNSLVDFIDTAYNDITIEGVVTFRSRNYSDQLATIISAVEDFFNPKSINFITDKFNMDWGIYQPVIGRSNIIKVIENHFGNSGIRVNLTNPTSDIMIKPLQFPRLILLTLTGEVI